LKRICSKNYNQLEEGKDINSELNKALTRNKQLQKENDNLKNMIDRLKKEEINAIFIVHNGENNDIDQSLEKFIRQICELFIGKYIWKQIGIIFTHYGYKKVKQDEIKEKGKEFIKNILKIADNEYENIIKNQNQNEKRYDRNEKITETLKCFYLNTEKVDNQYNIQTLNEIEKIKELTKDYPSINKIQSKFVTKIELKKDLKGESKNIVIREKKNRIYGRIKKSWVLYKGNIKYLFNSI